MSWTQPICGRCYAEKEPDRVPVRLRGEFCRDEHCCFCARPTREGIYYRADPRTVPFPAKDDDEPNL